MASADIFSTVVTSTVPTSPISQAEPNLTGPNDGITTVEPLTINDIKMFESLDLDSSGSSGIGNSNEAIIEGSLDEADSLLEDGNQHCKICKDKLRSPRVLACLHVFCEECIDGLLLEAEDPLNAKTSIECPECNQKTEVTGKAASLPPDYVLTNILDLSTMEPGALQCTSCKSAETAISRCNDCANFLCASCDNAHKYMRCFENHHVAILENLRSSDEKVAIHKPIFCATHNSENFKYYCFKCQVPVCNDCVVGEHKGAEHHYELIGEAETLMRNDIEDLMTKAKSKINYCDEASTSLGNALTELQSQHDTAHNTIMETYKRCTKILNERREQSLKDLDRLHSERELKIMDLMHNVEKCVEKTEAACKFTNKLLGSSNGTEFLCMKKLIGAQLMQLISDTPKADVHFSLEFDSKVEKFEQLANDVFGKFRTESTPPSPKESTPPPTLPGLPPTLNKSNIPCNSSQSALTGSVTASSPISLPTSMQSSFDGDMSNMGTSFLIPPSALTPDTIAVQQPAQSNTIQSNGPIGSSVVNQSGSQVLLNTSIAEYNLHRLANLAESTDIPDGIVPTPQPRPTTPQFTLADLISNERLFNNNLQALCKLGNFNNNELNTNGIPNHRPDSVMLSDYSMPSSTSPVGTIASLNENMNGLNGLNVMNGLGGINGLNGVNGMGGLNLNGNNVNIAGRIKATPMHIRYKFGSLGPSRVQFNSPHGFCLGVDEEIIVADTNNHRIQIFEKDGTFKMQFGVPGKEEGQLWYPRKVAVMRSNSKFVVCDRGNERSRMQIFTKNGHFIKKIAIRYIDIVAGLAVSNEGHIVAVDSVSPTVFVISEDGDLVHWFDCSDHMREPSDIAINGTDFYVCDFKGHCVAVFGQDGTFKYRIGNEKITCFPNGIDISDAGDILIGDSHGNRFHVACFSREGILQSEFECPHVKVSRCCGLKITSEGYVVTLAKNNHHVLVLNTLYIQ